MDSERPHTILCLASYFKGEEFLRECKRQGWRVLLITKEKLDSKEWPRESIDELFLMPDLTCHDDVVRGVSYLARSRVIDRIVPLDEFDLEVAAAVREHLRIPGMGETTARYFRDKLAMRMRARERGILVPDFVGVFNHDEIRDFTRRVSPPWLLKPRFAAAAIGIRKIHAADELWPILDQLGDEQANHVLEQFLVGDIYHVDSIVCERHVLFASAHRYGETPMRVAHEGGIFTTRTLTRNSVEESSLQALNRTLLDALGLLQGVTHAEFLKSRDDGRFYFIETAARVGGAHISDLVEAATGINLWREWARLETATKQNPYALPAHRNGYAGVLISLARQEHPNTSGYDAPEIVWRLEKRHHAGLIVASDDPTRVESLLETYLPRFQEDFMATLPVPEKPMD
jgi:hypothetical protein